MRRKIKWFFQKIFHGYSDSELWNLYYHLAKYILPRIQAFRRMKRMGWCDVGCNSPEEWEEILKQIEWALQFYANDSEEELYPTLTVRECHEKAEMGMKLFGKYFATLWD